MWGGVGWEWGGVGSVVGVGVWVRKVCVDGNCFQEWVGYMGKGS